MSSKHRPKLWLWEKGERALARVSWLPPSIWLGLSRSVKCQSISLNSLGLKSGELWGCCSNSLENHPTKSPVYFIIVVKLPEFGRRRRRVLLLNSEHFHLWSPDGENQVDSNCLATTFFFCSSETIYSTCLQRTTPQPPQSFGSISTCLYGIPRRTTWNHVCSIMRAAWCWNWEVWVPIVTPIK